METTKYLFNEIIKTWIDTLEKSRKQSTIVKYNNLYKKYIEPYFRKKYANDVTSDDIDHFLYTMQTCGKLNKKGGLSYSSVTTMKYIIKSALRLGFTQCKIKEITINFQVSKNRCDEIEVLTKDEQKKLEVYLFSHLDLSSLGILICLYTGLRLGEICALQWEDILLEESALIIRKTIQRLPENKTSKKTTLKITTPKSNSSLRKVPIPTFITKLLKENKNTDNPKVFLLSEKSEGPLDPRTYQYRFKRYLELSNIRNINFHALRHTFATRCIHTGIDVKTVSEILGHSNIQTTMNYYVYSSFEFKRKQIEKLQVLS